MKVINNHVMCWYSVVIIKIDCGIRNRILKISHTSAKNQQPGNNRSDLTSCNSHVLEIATAGSAQPISIKSTANKPILETLVGRTNDIVLLPSGKKAAGLTIYYVTKTVIEDDGNVKEFIIEQLKLDTFKISYVSTSELTSEKLTKIRDAVTKYLEPNLQVAFERKTALERSKSGKLKQFTSYL